MALNVVTRGYGPSASVSLVVTRGYTAGAAPAASGVFHRIAAPIDTAGDRASFVSLDEFAVTGTYTLVAGGSSSLSLIFLEPFREAYQRPGSATTAPAALVRADDIPATAKGGQNGDSLTVSGYTFRVRVIAPDGTGMVRLTLEEV